MNSFQSALFRPLDYFAKPCFADDSLHLARARSLVGINLFVAVLMAITVVFIVALNSLGQYSNLFIGYLVMPALIANIALPFVLRKTGRLRLCQHITLIIAFIGIIIGICSSGGPILAANNQLMILQAALALFLLGIRGGLIWSGIVLATQCFLYYLFIIGVDFPNIQPPEAAIASAIYNWALAFCAIISLILLIELSLGQLELQRHFERERFRYLATHDGLTELANRSLFEDELNKAIQHSQQSGSQVLLFYIDLDNFKPINDQWGHDVGDRVLKIVASRLKATTREADTVARLGGDEFAILLPNMATGISVNKLSETIYQRITQPIHLHGQYLDISCSIGVCAYPEHATSADQLWQLADAAMYVAKKSDAHWHIHRTDQTTLRAAPIP